jgi:hypothetical protein
MRNEPWVRRPLAARQVVRRLRQLVELARRRRYERESVIAMFENLT